MEKKKIIVSLAITLIFALFIGYGIEVFDPSPRNEDFCRQNLFEIQDEYECINEGGSWNENNIERPVPAEGFCNPTKECYDTYRLARVSHDKIVFIVSIIVGLIAIITGIILKKDEVSTGITGGGLLLILYGTIRYWQHANNILKFILLGVTLAVLIWISYKKLDRKHEKNPAKK